MLFSLHRIVSVVLMSAVVVLSLPVADAFSDVGASHPNKDAISFLAQKGILSGTGKNTFSPQRSVTRAEFLKILLLARYGVVKYEGDMSSCFSDVKGEEWYAPYLCFAKDQGILLGKDGEAFPAREITVVEGATLLVRGFGVSIDTGSGEQEWYVPFLRSVSDRGVLPPTLFYRTQSLTRAEAAEMIWRLLLGRGDRPSISHETLAASQCTPLNDDTPASIDMNRVRQAWHGWVNGERATRGLSAYELSPHLHASATTWSQFSRNQGRIDHKRPGTTAYYDYHAITSWFRTQGLVFKNIHGTTHTENIGWGYLSCGSGDCTDEAIASIKTTFDFFMSEKKYNGVHYRSMVNTDFRKMGVGLAISEKTGKYFLTIHYGTEIVSHPPEMCLR